MNMLDTIKQKLLQCVDQLAESRANYVIDPNRDFTRTRKITFRDVIAITLAFSGKSLATELMHYFQYAPDAATTPAFVQQRDKVRPDAFLSLLSNFNQQFPRSLSFQGYQLLAVDGTDLLIPTDPDDTDTYSKGQDLKGFNLLHINALYDLLHKVYLDVDIRPMRKEHDRAGLVSFLPRLENKDKSIILADRGYESYNVFAAFVQQKANFLIRIKDITAKISIAHSFHLPDGAFDLDVTRILTTKQTNLVKQHPETYKYLPQNVNFDYFDENAQCKLHLRFVRVMLRDGTYQCFATNLARNEFPPDTIRALYFLRWGIETSYRSLKHVVGLTHLHSKKRNGILQEIYASMIVYNFTSITTSYVKLKQTKRKHTYQINFSKAVAICRKFLRHPIPHIEALLAKHILPIRAERKYPRNVQFRKVVSFNYRIA